jgi:hypothetical protein
VIRAVSRSIAIAVLTLAVWGLGQITYIVAICPPHRAWVRAHADTSTVVLDSGEGVARPGDAIFVCETPHHIGPILWHEDLGCFCAPETVSVERLSTSVNGSCTVDKLFPTRDDTWGACRHARCNHHENF